MLAKNIYITALLAIVCSMPAAAAPKKKTVMITAFDVFDGRELNGSKVAAEELVKLNGPDKPVEYKLCLLPVIYDRAAAVATYCYTQMNPKPDIVISTGEGYCGVRLEASSNNLDNDSLADTAGKVHLGRVITEGAPKDELLTLPVADMHCATGTLPGPQTGMSISPENYVCNNTAHHLGRYFKRSFVPYGFIHVPWISCGADPAVMAKKIDAMARAALRSLEFPLWPFVVGKSSKEAYQTAVSLSDSLYMVTSTCRLAVQNKLNMLFEKRRAGTPDALLNGVMESVR